MRENNNKSRDTPLTKKALEVVSEVNEENIKETQATQSAADMDREEIEIVERRVTTSSRKMNPSLDGHLKKSEFILEELFLQPKLESPK